MVIVTVKARAVGDVSFNNVLIDKALDVGAVVPRTHIVQSVAVGRNAVAPVVEEEYPVSIAVRMLPLASYLLSFRACK